MVGSGDTRHHFKGLSRLGGGVRVCMQVCVGVRRYLSVEVSAYACVSVCV